MLTVKSNSNNRPQRRHGKHYASKPQEGNKALAMRFAARLCDITSGAGNLPRVAMGSRSRARLAPSTACRSISPARRAPHQLTTMMMITTISIISLLSGATVTRSLEKQATTECQRAEPTPSPETTSSLAPTSASASLAARQVSQQVAESKHRAQQSDGASSSSSGSNISISGNNSEKELGQQREVVPLTLGTSLRVVATAGSKPDRKSLAELEPEDDLSKYLFKNFEPRWMDACNHRPDRNDTLVKLLVGTLSPHSAEEIEHELREHGTYFKRRHTNKTQAASTSGAHVRRKRAIPLFQLNQISHKRQQPQQLQVSSSQVYTFQDSEKSAILFKGNNYNTKKWWPKKTTFKLSQMKYNQGQYYHHNQHQQLSSSRSKNRFFVTDQPTLVAGQRPPTAIQEAISGQQQPTTPEPQQQTVSTTATPTTPTQLVIAPEHKRHHEQMNVLVNSLFQLDVRMSWQLIASLNTISQLRKHREELIGVIEEDVRLASHEPDVGDTRRAEIQRQRLEWLPKYEDLVLSDDNPSSLYNVTGGLYDAGVRELLINITHYIQFYSVALEQMKYDQTHLRPKLGSNIEYYREVDKHLQKLLCETENYLNLEREYLNKRSQFYELYAVYKPTTIEGLELFYQKFINNLLPRGRPNHSQLKIESAITRAFDKLAQDEQTKVLQKMETFLPENLQSASTGDPQDHQYENESPLKPQMIARRLTRPTHIWREIMPLQQRQLFSIKERAERDLFILNELYPVTRTLESLMKNNFI